MEAKKITPRRQRILKELCELCRLAQRTGFQYQIEGDEGLELSTVLSTSKTSTVKIRVRFPQDYPCEPPIIETSEFTDDRINKASRLSDIF